MCDERVPEDRVGKILDIIAAPPGRRNSPGETDLPGDFDYWFEGGACRIHTGSLYFTFEDGTEAHVVFPAPWLNVNIVFADGAVVDVVQRRKAGSGEVFSAGIRTDALHGKGDSGA